MTEDYREATARLMDRFRRPAKATSTLQPTKYAEAQANDSRGMVINNPSHCTIIVHSGTPATGLPRQNQSDS